MIEQPSGAEPDRPLLVVTVTYSPGPHLDRFLKTLAHATERRLLVVMADNGSTDGSDAIARASSIPSYAGGAAIDRESGFLREKKRNTRPESPLLFLLRVLS